MGYRRVHVLIMQRRDEGAVPLSLGSMTSTSRACGDACPALSPPRPETGEIGRRTFLTQSALLVATAALAACAVGSDPTAPTLSGPISLKVSDYSSLSSVGGVALVSIQSSPFAIVRTGTSSFVALSRVCPHQGSIVNQNGSGFLCPGHGARFDASGTWIGGERTSSLHSYPTAYDAATGTLTVG
jgi:nitrite reductase/ring-hydroxylating ferredoxin subunit